MKKVYWRPNKVSRNELLLIAIVAMVGIAAVESLLIKVKQPHYEQKIAAAKLAAQAMEVIKAERIKRGQSLDPESDPAQTGLIGTLMSQVTTNTGHLPAKQTSVNPNWAAVLVEMMRKGGVEDGDTIAVGFSGSFPALNICTLAAVQALNLTPVVITSASGSQWGANDPELTWLDMERILFERRVFAFRSIAASRGGIDDRGIGLAAEGRKLLDEIIRRNGIPMIQPRDYLDSLNQRMLLYQQYAGDKPIKIYLNVGGGTTSVGTAAGKRMFRPGLNRSLPGGDKDIDSVMVRFALDGVPVIHITKVEELAERYALPLAPAQIPPVGQGTIYFREEYNRWLAIGVLLVILGMMYAFIRMDWGFRIMRRGPTKQSGYPERMV